MTTLPIEASTPLYNRVPKVTVDFWLVKLMAVTVGETAADFLSADLGLGLPTTSIIMSLILVVMLVIQFKQKKYVPLPYWITVVLISIVGTLITDYLVDDLGASLEITSIVFAIALGLTFSIWYSNEKSLSIHTIYTMKRESFYWFAILLTFALGTAAGDYAAEGLDLGYLQAGLMYCAIIAAIALAFYANKINGVLAFWLAYILTRPMGASFGDYLSQPVENGGVDFGTVITSAFFLAAIALIVLYMTLSRDGEETALDVI